jgi:hypothetical protein
MSEEKDQWWQEKDLFDAIEAESDKFSDLSTEGGAQLSHLIEVAGMERENIADLEDRLKKAKARHQMQEMGLDKVEADGNVVKLKQFVSASMPKDPLQKTQALEHLRSIGKADFIKNEVNVRFGVSQDDQAVALQNELDGQGHDVTSKVWIEPQTLKKMIREAVENGEPIELERFNAFIGTVAEIKGEK